MLNNIRKSLFSFNAETKYSAQHQLLSALARLQGFRLYNRNLLWIDVTSPVSREWQAIFKKTGPIKDRHFTLYSLACSVANLPGDTVECGVYLGEGSFFICAATQGTPGRLHHVFDSFEGLSEPDENDKPKDDRAYYWHKYDLSVPLKTVQSNLKQFDFVHYYPGWIPERFSEISNRQFAFVHVDVDLYQPTHDSIAFFYERMVPGGIMLCDDYGFTTCPGATKAFDEFIADKPERCVVHLPTGQGFIVKR